MFHSRKIFDGPLETLDKTYQNGSRVPEQRHISIIILFVMCCHALLMSQPNTYGATFSRYLINVHTFSLQHYLDWTCLDSPVVPSGHEIWSPCTKQCIGLDRPPCFLNLCYFTFLTVSVRLTEMGTCPQCCLLFLRISVCKWLDSIKFCLYLVLLICIWLYFCKLLIVGPGHQSCLLFVRISKSNFTRCRPLLTAYFVFELTLFFF